MIEIGLGVSGSENLGFCMEEAKIEEKEESLEVCMVLDWKVFWLILRERQLRKSSWLVR